jgi:tetratricopeptide (TPR) repeat protein
MPSLTRPAGVRCLPQDSIAGLTPGASRHADQYANLASTYRNQGRWKEAEELFVQVMETRKRVLGAEHPDTLTSMSNLAFTWKRQGRGAEALNLMEECVQLRTRILGADHPHILSSSAALIGWQAKKLDIGASTAEDMAEQEHS